MKYEFRRIEKKWQKYWAKNQTFKTKNNSKKPKYYALDMFPYPSGKGLHVGHPLGYIASDILARYKRHKGFNVLHPQGYDSFGLPTEQHAIETGEHPSIITERNIDTYRKQLDQIGFSFDWSREIRTSDPKYYRWTQWIFIQLFHSYYCNDTQCARPIKELSEVFESEGNLQIHASCDEDTPLFSAEAWHKFTDSEKQNLLLKYRLVYLGDSFVNWCAELGTVLANDEVINGVSERGGYPVIRKKMIVWKLRITAYLERLLQGLDSIDWPSPIKEIQRNWIGKSKGALVRFEIINEKEKIEVFTTRPDTIFGVSFITLAPEHPLVEQITSTSQKNEIKAYVNYAARKSDLERVKETKTVTGAFTGAYAKHPFTKKPIPIWIGDYVLLNYGTGGVMGVPCGDNRDHAFAKHFEIDIPNIFKGVDVSVEAHMKKAETIITNSDFLNDLDYHAAFSKAIKELEKVGAGGYKTNYKLRDIPFARQRYWGEPFPVYYVDGLPQTIDESFLPLTLPKVDNFKPSKSGDSPLKRAKIWAWCTATNKVVKSKSIDHKRIFPLDTGTMPGFAGSSQYFNRYMDPHNEDEIFSQEAITYWKQVDLYIGGSEHATGHLIYSRFWQKFMFDLKKVPVDEYAKKLINQGMILGTSALIYRISGTQSYIPVSLKRQYNSEPIHVDINLVDETDELDIEKLKSRYPRFKNATFTKDKGSFKVEKVTEKMSKSKLNVVNPDQICRDYGADSLRMFEMFLGPLEHSKPWNTDGISGVHNFLKKVWKLYFTADRFCVTDAPAARESLKSLHKTIKKIEEDINSFSFNTCVSTFMIATTELSQQKCRSREILSPFAILLSPFAPHLAEELWEALGHSESISNAPFPKYLEEYLKENTKVYPVSFNGKKRFELELPVDMSKAEIEKAVMNHEKTPHYLDKKTPKRLIIIPGKIVNIVL